MEQIAILSILRRHVLMIIAVCVIATVTGYALSFLLPTRYSASALLLVRPQQPIKMGTEKDNKEFLNFPMGGASAVETASRTYIEMIKSRALIGEVVRELGLDKETVEEETGSSKFAWLLPAGLRLADVKESLQDFIAVLRYGSVIEEDPSTKAVKQVSNDLSLEALLDTYTFEIKYSAKDPLRAADVANTTAKTLIKFVNDLRLSEGRHQGDNLKAELEQSRQQVSAARERLENYKKVHSIFLYESEFESKLKVISELNIELAKAEAALVGSQNTLSNVSLTARHARLVRAIAEREAELVSMPRIEREMKQLEQDLKDALTAYETVEKQSTQVDLNQSYGMPEVHLVSEAAAPRLPSSPRRGIITVVSFLGGGVVAVGLAFLLEYLNRRVRSIQDIEDFVGIKVLATIPRVSWRRWRHAGLL